MGSRNQNFGPSVMKEPRALPAVLFFEKIFSGKEKTKKDRE
jgi:hypothetical protein